MSRKPKSRNNYTKKKEFDPRTVCPGMKVTVQGDDDKAFAKALRIFNKKVQESRMLRELREREYYEKPSIARKRKKAIAIKREQKRRASEAPNRKRYY